MIPLPSSPTLGVVFITHRARHLLERSLPPILKSPLKPRVLVVNSSSEDGTVELAQQMGAETLVIPRREFNHGSTRERARRHLATDVVVMMTPDAFATDSSLLERLMEPLVSLKASVSYARQIEHQGASLLESFPRWFNYPATSHVRSIEESSDYGPYLFFCSNSCAAYRQDALDSVGGFPSVLLGEDFYVVAKLLRAGHRIAYVAEAVVRHSHHYSLRQEFSRYFDMGLARKQAEALIEAGGRDEKRGARYVGALLACLARKRPWLIPYAFVQSAVKWLGYASGRRACHAPLFLKRSLSGQDFYWDSVDYTEDY